MLTQLGTPLLGTTNRRSYLRGSHRHTAVVSRSARITDREVVSPVGRASVTRTRSPGDGISASPTASQFLLNLVIATDPRPVVPRDTFTCNDRRESPSSDSTVPSRWFPQSAAQSGVDSSQNAGQNGMHGQYRHVPADGLAASPNGRLTWRLYLSSASRARRPSASASGGAISIAARTRSARSISPRPISMPFSAARWA